MMIILSLAFPFLKIKSASLAELEAIKDIGGVIARSLYDFFQNRDNLDFLDKLKTAGAEPVKAKFKKSGKLAGQTFVLTGSLDSLTRDEAADKIRLAGGDVSASVSQKTDYLVAGAEPGSKFAKAKKLVVKIIDEKEFLNLLK